MSQSVAPESLQISSVQDESKKFTKTVAVSSVDGTRAGYIAVAIGISKVFNSNQILSKDCRYKE